DSGASIHCVRDAQHVRNQRAPRPGEEYMVVGDGNKLRVECFGDLDLVLHCE
ncbi:unnamed protein product, partial [Hapterophycus canaliculatus]